MTRAMAVTVLYRQAGSPSVDGLKNIFKDVPDDQYYADAVIWANSKGIVSGVSADRFDPSGKITREQLATMLWRYAGSPSVSGRMTGFVDADQISGYAEEALKWAAGNGIISGMGNGTLNPKGSATRAQVASMLKRVVENILN